LAWIGFDVMCAENYRFRLIVLSTIILTPVLWSRTTLAATNCVTADCHAIMGKARFVHQPVKKLDCESCHQSTKKDHPGVKGAFRLVALVMVLMEATSLN